MTFQLMTWRGQGEFNGRARVDGRHPYKGAGGTRRDFTEVDFVATSRALTLSSTFSSLKFVFNIHRENSMAGHESMDAIRIEEMAGRMAMATGINFTLRINFRGCSKRKFRINYRWGSKMKCTSLVRIGGVVQRFRLMTWRWQGECIESRPRVDGRDPHGGAGGARRDVRCPRRVHGPRKGANLRQTRTDSGI